ncbi:hypothetical protein K491DRAFT_579803, partial [Lophiostoma macrostomum CBS 122681]
DDNETFTFDIQLNTEEDPLQGFRQSNHGNEIQRPNIIDECCKGLIIQARIDRIVHGLQNRCDPATLIVFGFRFHGLDNKRRFKQAAIALLFEDERERLEFGPEVNALWPNGDFTLGQTTEINVETTKSVDSGLNLTGGAGVQAGGHATVNWERKTAYKKTDRSSMTGTIFFDDRVQGRGPYNAVRLTIKENTAVESGVVTDLRAVVLLKRRNDRDRFTVKVTVEAKAHFLYNAIRGVREIVGAMPSADPVIFKPGTQYLRSSMGMNILGAHLGDEIDENDLREDHLGNLGGVLTSTVL